MGEVSRYFRFIKERIVDDWKDFAYELGFTYAEITNFDHNNRDYPTRCLAVLVEWKKGKKRAPVHIYTLMDALTKLELMSLVDGLKGEFPELQDYENRYDGSSGSTPPENMYS